MKKIVSSVVVCVVILSLFAIPAYADGHGGEAAKSVTSGVDVNLSGWARVEYGVGDDRYSDAIGEDRFGVAKAALITEASYENFSLFALLGTRLISNEADETEFKEVYVTAEDAIGDGDISVGFQPILFGLKSSGYEGDRSILPSIEFGGAGGFAVSNQDAAAVRVVYPVMDGIDLELGGFDTSETSGVTGSVDGSSIWNNGWVQIRGDGAIIEGLYGVAGIESRYVGATDDSEPIYTVGGGYRTDLFDVSAEWISLDKSITGTLDDETYIVVEATLMASDDINIIVDWATADELDVDTIRAGVHYMVNDHVEARVEYGGDFDIVSSTTGVKDDIHSVDARLTFMY